MSERDVFSSRSHEVVPDITSLVLPVDAISYLRRYVNSLQHRQLAADIGAIDDFMWACLPGDARRTLGYIGSPVDVTDRIFDEIYGTVDNVNEILDRHPPGLFCVVYDDDSVHPLRSIWTKHYGTGIEFCDGDETIYDDNHTVQACAVNPLLHPLLEAMT